MHKANRKSQKLSSLYKMAEFFFSSVSSQILYHSKLYQGGSRGCLGVQCNPSLTRISFSLEIVGDNLVYCIYLEYSHT